MRLEHLIFVPALWIGQAQAFILPEQPLRAYECSHCESLSHDVLSAHWDLDNALLGHDTLHGQNSKKYTIATTLEALQKGVSFNTLAPAALIRITAVNPENAVKPQFYLQTQSLKKMTLQEASSRYSQDASGLDAEVTADTLAILQLKPELGFGKFVLQSKALNGHETDKYLIHVFDKFSSTYMRVETDKAHYQYGDKLITTISLRDDATGYPLDLVRAKLVTPDGKIIALAIKPIRSKLYKAKIPLLYEKAFQGENGYIEAEVETNIDGYNIKRQAHTAFSYAIPSAAIRSISLSNPKAAELWQVTAQLEVTTGSRYRLQAVLFATNDEGKRIPIETAQSAAWFSAGLQELVFSFDPKRAHQFKPPYYIGQLQLIDYGQLKPVFAYNDPINLNQLGYE